MSDDQLAAGLRVALGRTVTLEERRPSAYASSVPLEEIRVDGEWIVFKDLSPRPRPSRPSFLVDPLREIAAYRDVLGPTGLGAPALRGALADRGGDRAWLFLERVRGVPLWQTLGLDAWSAAARWLAALHARPLPAAPGRLARYDAAWLRAWVHRAAALGVADRVLEVARRAAERVAAWPASLVHGDFYASNVLVEAAARIRPVDWETAGVGPGLLDLAALTSGEWTGEERARLEDAYRDALPPARRPDGAELADAARDCRLLLAVQWLVLTTRFTPPREQARDWLADAERLAAEIEG